jgi:hypothetical protein
MMLHLRFATKIFPTCDLERRLYFSSQRGQNGNGIGVTFEVSGPF